MILNLDYLCLLATRTAQGTEVSFNIASLLRDSGAISQRTYDNRAKFETLGDLVNADQSDMSDEETVPLFRVGLATPTTTGNRKQPEKKKKKRVIADDDDDDENRVESKATDDGVTIELDLSFMKAAQPQQQDEEEEPKVKVEMTEEMKQEVYEHQAQGLRSNGYYHPIEAPYAHSDITLETFFRDNPSLRHAKLKQIKFMRDERGMVITTHGK